MEIITMESSDIESDTDFRMEFEPKTPFFQSVDISNDFVFALCLALGIGMALTRRRTRAPSMIMIGVWAFYRYPLLVRITYANSSRCC